MNWIKAGAAIALIVAVTLMLGSCGDSNDARRFAFEKFVSNNKVGSGPDYWLVKLNAFGDHERVALVFGFVDDYDFCSDVAKLYMSKYQNARYSCEKAN